ncbi:MAG: SUMF1/EgtB/PvdO family nonheme iron enzyme, partial [Pseudomonadota bacterium]
MAKSREFSYLIAACLLLVSSLAHASDFVELEGGTFTMGSDRHYQEERLTRNVTLSPYAIQATEVTNRQFADFVEATGYVTTAEVDLDPSKYPNMPADLLRAGSMVFAQPDKDVDINDFRH